MSTGDPIDVRGALERDRHRAETARDIRDAGIHCPSCSYDLAGTFDARCPECGRDIHAALTAEPPSRIPHVAGYFGIALGSLLLWLWAVIVVWPNHRPVVAGATIIALVHGSFAWRWRRSARIWEFLPTSERWERVNRCWMLAILGVFLLIPH